MNSMTHPVAPEEIMALLDGELTSAEAKVVAAHVEECGECAALRGELRGTAEALKQWNVPSVSAATERVVVERAKDGVAAARAARPRRMTALSFRNWRLWAIGGAGALAVVGAIALFVTSTIYYEDRPRRVAMYEVVQPPTSASTSVESFAYSGRSDSAGSRAGLTAMQSMPLSTTAVNSLAKLQPGVLGAATPPSGPMIARTVSLTVLVKNIGVSRTALDALLAQHHGYAAQLTMNTPENGARSFQSSLRIPAGELAAALDALRGLGRVQTETQSGEEVTQQHTDLVARLTNARETETRLRAILQQRTGKMQDVLDVEEKISETRGEIEQMEAEQKALEHRVDFASVDLQLTEEYKAQLGGGVSTGVGTQMGNSFVAGLRRAGDSLLGLVLFLEEFGPALVLWAVLLGGPVWVVWRIRRRRVGGR